MRPGASISLAARFISFYVGFASWGRQRRVLEEEAHYSHSHTRVCNDKHKGRSRGQEGGRAALRKKKKQQKKAKEEEKVGCLPLRAPGGRAGCRGGERVDAGGGKGAARRRRGRSADVSQVCAPSSAVVKSRGSLAPWPSVTMEITSCQDGWRIAGATEGRSLCGNTAGANRGGCGGEATGGRGGGRWWGRGEQEEEDKSMGWR